MNPASRSVGTPSPGVGSEFPRLQRASLGEPNYDTNQAFNDEQDEESGYIDIGADKFWASEILFRMAPQAYRAALAEFRERQAERSQEVVLTHYPAPVAYAYHLFREGFQHQTQRLLLMRDTWESVIALLYFLVVSEARSRSVSFPWPRQTKEEDGIGRLLTNSPSRRLDLINTLLRSARTASI